MLTKWQEEAVQPELKARITQFLLAVDEIEGNTKAVLGIIAAALGAS